MLSGAQLTVVGQAGSKMKRAVDGLGTRSYPVHPRPVCSARTPEAGLPLSSILAFQAFKDVSCTPRPHLSLPLPSPVSLSVPPSPTIQHTATAIATMSYTVDDLVASLSSNHINQEAIDLQDVRVCATRLYAIFLCVSNFCNQRHNFSKSFYSSNSNNNGHPPRLHTAMPMRHALRPPLAPRRRPSRTGLYTSIAGAGAPALPA